MAAMILKTSRRKAVDRIATPADVCQSLPAFLITKVVQVVCNMVTLTTRTREHGLFDVFDMIIATSRCAAVCGGSAPADVRAEILVLVLRVQNMAQVLVPTSAMSTAARVLEVQMKVLQVSLQVLVMFEFFTTLGLKARPV